MDKKFKGDTLVVSVGFDTYKGDPLANLRLEVADYNKIGKLIKSLDLPTFFVLEGGYSQKIGKCALSFLQGFKSGLKLQF